MDIDDISREARPSALHKVRAQHEGTVIDVHVTEGQFVKLGDPLVTIADLSRVWLELAAYESDLPWLQYGQEATFETEAFPSKTFKATLVYIDHELDPHTRTVRVMLEVPNPGGILKRDMFARARIQANWPGANGKPPQELIGKYIAPRHPEFVTDGPGFCKLCGLPMVRAEILSWRSDTGTQQPLVIPVSAALITGERAVVYVAVDGEAGRFEGREVVLGPRAGDYFTVWEGLEEGEKSGRQRCLLNWTVNCNCKGKPSMMYAADPDSPKPKKTVKEEEGPTSLGVDPQFSASLDPLLQGYFDIQDGLSKDNLAKAFQAVHRLDILLIKADAGRLKPEERSLWVREELELKAQIQAMRATRDIAKAREAFQGLSAQITRIVQQFGAGQPVHRFYCPMAFDDKGAYWLQNHEATANPYFGASMFACGSKQETLNEGQDGNP